MNEKEKQIEEMAYSICNLPEMYGITKSCSTCGNKGRCKPQWKAEKLYAAGYRKQSEVVKDFVKTLKERFEKTSTMATALHGRRESEITSIIDIVAAEFGAKVE